MHVIVNIHSKYPILIIFRLFKSYVYVLEGGVQVPVPSTKIISRKSQRADGTFRDVQELRIRRLRGRDLGEYVCVRTVAGVVLTKSVQILLNCK